MKDLGLHRRGTAADNPSDNPPPGRQGAADPEPFSLEKLRPRWASPFKGAKIIDQKMVLEKVDAHLLVKDGTLKLAPLSFDLAGRKTGHA